jgi:hypothetical protein
MKWISIKPSGILDAFRDSCQVSPPLFVDKKINSGTGTAWMTTGSKPVCRSVNTGNEILTGVSMITEPLVPCSTYPGAIARQLPPAALAFPEFVNGFTDGRSIIFSDTSVNCKDAMEKFPWVDFLIAIHPSCVSLNWMDSGSKPSGMCIAAILDQDAPPSDVSSNEKEFWLSEAIAQPRDSSRKPVLRIAI